MDTFSTDAPRPRTDADLARALALTRIAIGVVFTVAPGVAGRTWIGRDAGHAGTKVFARGLAARDAALGVGALTAMRRGKPTRGWFEAAALSDAGDALATLLSWRKLPFAGRWGGVLLATTGAVLSAKLARTDLTLYDELEPPRPDEPRPVVRTGGVPAGYAS